MNIRLYSNENDYQMVCDWWTKRSMPILGSRVLQAVGYVAHEGDKDIACAWLYMDYASGVCWLNLFITNPEAPISQVIKAHDAIVNAFKLFAEIEQCVIMLAFYERPSLARLAVKQGFQVNHEHTTQLFMPLTPKEEAA